jgi:hypothetical protein
VAGIEICRVWKERCVFGFAYHSFAQQPMVQWQRRFGFPICCGRLRATGQSRENEREDVTQCRTNFMTAMSTVCPNVATIIANQYVSNGAADGWNYAFRG